MSRIALIDAFLAGDIEAAVALLDENATFNSPVRSYTGVERIRPLWTTLDGIIEDIRPAGVLEGHDETAAFFAGTFEGEAIDGVLRVRSHNGSAATDVTLMLRPYAPTKAAIREMGRRLGG